LHRLSSKQKNQQETCHGLAMAVLLSRKMPREIDSETSALALARFPP